MGTNWIGLLFEVENTFLKNFLAFILKDINKAKVKTLCFYQDTKKHRDSTAKITNLAKNNGC